MKKPDIHPSVFVAPGAVVRGDVQLAAGSSVFYNAVLRGDRAAISIGDKPHGQTLRQLPQRIHGRSRDSTISAAVSANRMVSKSRNSPTKI